MNFNYIKDSKNNYTVLLGGKSYQFNETHINFEELVECVKCEDGVEFMDKFNIAKVVTDWSLGDFKAVGGVLYYLDNQIHPSLSNRIFAMIDEGFGHGPMLRFIENLYKNPSFRAINELYSFLEHKALPITPDGYFIAYKAVRSDFTDKHSGTFLNTVGSKPCVARFKVDDNCDIGCSYGLHVGSIEYVKGFGSKVSGDKVVICKVNPADVVSVPLDSDCQKVRCCTYEVISEYEEDILEAVYMDMWDTIGEDAHPEDEDYREEDEDEDEVDSF